MPTVEVNIAGDSTLAWTILVVQALGVAATVYLLWLIRRQLQLFRDQTKLLAEQVEVQREQATLTRMHTEQTVAPRLAIGEAKLRGDGLWVTVTNEGLGPALRISYGAGLFRGSIMSTELPEQIGREWLSSSDALMTSIDEPLGVIGAGSDRRHQLFEWVQPPEEATAQEGFTVLIAFAYDTAAGVATGNTTRLHAVFAELEEDPAH